MYELINFTPGKVAEATGLSVVMQNDWRKRGLLPATEGHARFDIFDVADIRVRKLLAERGLGPKESSSFGSSAKAAVVKRVLKFNEAWENYEIIDSSLISAAYRDVIDKVSHEKGGDQLWFNAAFGGDGDFFVVAPDGSSTVVGKIGEFFDSQNERDREGVFHVLDLFPVARGLISKLGPVIRLNREAAA